MDHCENVSANAEEDKSDTEDCIFTPMALLQVVGENSMEDFDSTRQHYCDVILQQIREFQRQKRVEYLRTQMNHQAEGAMLARVGTLISESSDESEEELSIKYAIDHNGSIPKGSQCMVSPKSMTSDEPDSTPIIRVANQKSLRSRGTVWNATKYTHKESLCFEMLIPSGFKILESKLFFFCKILWKVTLGVNNHHLEYYYVFLSPTEKLVTDFRMHCKFIISPPASSDPMPPYCIDPPGDFVFPAHSMATRGIEKFIGTEIADYLTSEKSIRLTIELSTNYPIIPTP